MKLQPAELISLIAVISSGLIGFAAIVVQFFSQKILLRSEISKLMYIDRLTAYRDLNSCIAEIAQSIKIILTLKNISNRTISQMHFNTENDIFPIGSDLGKVFNTAFAKILSAKDNCNKIIRRDGILYSKEVFVIINELNREYFDIFPEPIFPGIEDFLDNKYELLDCLLKKLNEKANISLKGK